MEVKQLPELLKSYLGHDKPIQNYEIKRLTALGENYGSQVLSLKVFLQDKTLEAIAKIPPEGEFINRMFNIPVTFKNEIDFYKKILPTLNTFLEEKHCADYLDCFPEFWCARLTLKEHCEEVDDDAVLILENLNTKGYVMADRFVGFDYATSIALIKAMVKYHSVPLALKLCKPEVFNAKIRSLFKPYMVFEVPNEAVIKKEKTVIENIESCREFAERVEAALWKSKTPIVKCSEELVREPFGTVIHTDLWTNNFLIKQKEDGSVDGKILDFQLGEYGSPLRDLIFFLYSSVQIPVLAKHCDEFLELYKNSLREDLLKFGCDIEPFSDQAFEKETLIVIEQYILFQCLVMLNPIYEKKAKELDQLGENDLTGIHEVSDEHKERAEFIVKDFIKRNWI